MADENGFIRISNRELYDILVQVRDRVAGVENTVNNVLSENVDLRKRTRSLELKFYGILAGMIGAMSMFGALLIKNPTTSVSVLTLLLRSLHG